MFYIQNVEGSTAVAQSRLFSLRYLGAAYFVCMAA
jgi:hypothetical protein